MDEPFDLPVDYMGERLLLKASLLVYGYSHKFQVEVAGHIIILEPDEERNYRAVINPDEFEKGIKIDPCLLQLIAASLEALVK